MMTMLMKELQIEPNVFKLRCFIMHSVYDHFPTTKVIFNSTCIEIDFTINKIGLHMRFRWVLDLLQNCYEHLAKQNAYVWGEVIFEFLEEEFHHRLNIVTYVLFSNVQCNHQNIIILKFHIYQALLIILKGLKGKL